MNSGQSNFDNCLEAVAQCDMFLGILTTSYGSGVDAEGLSITHREIKAAMQRDIPRWFLAHRDLEMIYALVRNLGHRVPEDVLRLNETMQEVKARGRRPLVENFRVLEMYAEVIQAKRVLPDRRGNWAQPFYTDHDGLTFVKAQFLRYAEALEELQNFKGMTTKGGN